MGDSREKGFLTILAILCNSILSSLDLFSLFLIFFLSKNDYIIFSYQVWNDRESFIALIPLKPFLNYLYLLSSIFLFLFLSVSVQFFSNFVLCMTCRFGRVQLKLKSTPSSSPDLRATTIKHFLQKPFNQSKNKVIFLPDSNFRSLKKV